MLIQSLLHGPYQSLHSGAVARSVLNTNLPRVAPRQRQSPLPTVRAVLLRMRAASQQHLLGSVFGAITNTAVMVSSVSNRPFAKAPSHLHMRALSPLNDRVLSHAGTDARVPRWRSLRLVAGGALVMRPAMRRCKRTQHLAVADQRLSALFLHGAAVAVDAVVHAICKSDRALLANPQDELLVDDALLVDRGYPAARQVNLLDELGPKFIIRCDTTTSSGRRRGRQFTSSSRKEADLVLKTAKSAGGSRLELLCPGGDRAGDAQHCSQLPDPRTDDQIEPQRGCCGNPRIAAPPPITHRGDLQVTEAASQTRRRQRFESVCCGDVRGRKGAHRQPACVDMHCPPYQRQGRNRQALCAILGLEHPAPRRASSAAAAGRESADRAVRHNAHDRTPPEASITGLNHQSCRCQVQAASKSDLQGVSGHKSAALASVARDELVE